MLSTRFIFPVGNFFDLPMDIGDPIIKRANGIKKKGGKHEL